MRNLAVWLSVQSITKSEFSSGRFLDVSFSGNDWMLIFGLTFLSLPSAIFTFDFPMSSLL